MLTPTPVPPSQLDATSAAAITTARIMIRDARFALFISFPLERVLLQREHRAGGIGDDDERVVSPLRRRGDNHATTQ